MKFDGASIVNGHKHQCGLGVGSLRSYDVPVKFGDSRSNRSQGIRLPHIVTGERMTNDTGVRRSSHKAKMPYWLLPKNTLLIPFHFCLPAHLLLLC